jgi:adenosylcobinamide amidohydrolase
MKYTCTESHLHVDFEGQACHVLSSAVWNGGMLDGAGTPHRTAQHVLNMKVPSTYTGEEDAVEIIKAYANQHGIDTRSARTTTTSSSTYEENVNGSEVDTHDHDCDDNVVVGLMTAASMQSLRVKTRVEQGYTFTALVTSGMSNARRAGDKAEYRHIVPPPLTTGKAGTINVIVWTDALLSPAAMAEALMLVTEARTVAVMNFHMPSPISPHLTASGTGTDATVIACQAPPLLSSALKSASSSSSNTHANTSANNTPPTVEWCGKHTLVGEILATLVMEAVTESVQAGVDYVASLQKR